MNRNTKVLLSVLVIFGFAIILRVGFFVQKTLYGIKAEKPKIEQRKAFAACPDKDSDGLCDISEDFFRTNILNADTDGDGYLDGEEVASGCNPRIPSPDDGCPHGPRKNKNLTRQTAKLVVGGIYSGDLLDNKKPAYALGINALARVSAFDETGPLNDPDIADSDIVVAQDSEKATANYLNILSILVGNQLLESASGRIEGIQSGLEGLVNGKEDYKNVFLAYANSFRALKEQLAQVPVPDSWKDIHKEALSSTEKFAMIYTALAYTNDDPLKALTALTGLQKATERAQSLIAKITKRSSELTALPDQRIFSVIQALNKITNE